MKLILTFCFCIVYLVSFSQVKYVDVTNGNDSNDGNSTSSAWQTIQKAMDEATPGTTVYIRNGVYTEPDLQLNVSGTSGATISFRNYPGEAPLISGNNQQGTLLYIENRSYFEIYGLTFANLVGNNSVGVEITGNTHDFNFRKNKIHDISWTANTSAIPTANDNANAFVIYGSTNPGVWDFTIDSCEIYNNATGYSESLTLDGNVYNFFISYNSVHDNSNIGILCAGHYGVFTDPDLDQTRFGRIYDNICYNNASNYATSAGIYIDGGKEIEVFRNLCYGNGYGIEVGAEEDGTTSLIRIYGNLVYDNLQGGIAVGGYDTGTTGQVTQSLIRNNTLYNNGVSGNSLGELYITKVSNTVFENNVFVSKGTGKLITKEVISPQSANTFQYNLWFSEGNFDAYIDGTNYNTFDGMNAALNETNSVNADPAFENTTTFYDLHVVDGSPAINAGNPDCFIFPYETDFDGTERVLNLVIDIGAYEWYVTSLPELTENWLQIFPNPGSDITLIHMKHPGTLKIHDSNGRIIMECAIQSEHYLNMESWSKGHYFFTLTTENETQTKLVLKN